MTTFVHKDQDADSLRIGVWSSITPTAFVTADHCASGESATVHVPKADAPAVALAILEAAGWTSTTSSDPAALPANAVYTLRKHVDRVARKAEEEALDREALELLNAATESNYPTMPDNVIGSVWRRAARKARELHS